MSGEKVSSGKIAEKWGISQRRVNQLCNAGKIEGAVKNGRFWKIPADSRRPDVLRENTHYEYTKKVKRLPCPVGITSYKEVSTECYYVDKTLMLKEMIDEHSKVMLFTRPRRFGKTLTMDMVKTFFEMTEEDTSVYFSNRAIWSCGKLYRSYQGAFPVIFLSFKDAHQNSWKDMYESLLISLRNEFKRHRAVLENENVSDIDKTFFGKILNGETSEVENQLSLGQLSHILSDAYGKRVVVIIDEYDTPIQQGYNYGYYNEVIAFMRNLFSAVFKDNASLELGILTGILRVAKESLFSGLNNLIVNTVLDEKYSEYFGFTAEEVKEMAVYYGQTDKLLEIRTWYDGYLFGQNEIYNPWSVICYFNNNCNPRAFWSRTSGNDMIMDIIRNGDLEMQKSLMKLLQDESVQAVIDTDIIYPEIKSSEDTIYSFLMMTGYLKIHEIVNVLDDRPVSNLRIPNKEIKSVFKREIIDNLSKAISQPIIRNFQLAIKTNNGEMLQETLCQYLLQSASNFDTAHENFYHGMMLGLLAIMSDDYQITSNREAGEGRFDIELKPFSKKNAGIIMEFKAMDKADEEQLAYSAENAIKQIQNRKYDTNLRTDDITDIQLYGIAFSKKKAVVKTCRL